MMRLKKLGLLVALLSLGACASGVNRPLGKCSDGAERRPVNVARWPGGMPQLRGEVPAAGEPAATPRRSTGGGEGQTVTVKPIPAPSQAPARSAPPAAPPPAVLRGPSDPAVPGTIDLNPMTPRGAGLAAPADQETCKG